MEKEQSVCKNKVKTFKFTEKNRREKGTISQYFSEQYTRNWNNSKS